MTGTPPTAGSDRAGLVHNHAEWRKAFFGALISLHVIILKKTRVSKGLLFIITITCLLKITIQLF